MSQTSSQIVVDMFDGTIPRTPPTSTFTYAKARTMRLHPSISLGREFAIAPIISAGWGAEGDDAQCQWLMDQLADKRTELMRTALLGEIDFGWKAYEIIYDAVEGLDKIKPLKNDITWARRSAVTGDYLGLKTLDLYNGQEVYIDAIHSLFISQDEEGLGAYGTARLAKLESIYDQWADAAETAARFDRKIAGGVWAIHYNPTQIRGSDGELKDPYDVAVEAATNMRASGVLILPNEPQNIGDKAVKSFEIERHDASGSAADMVARLKYLDSLLFRGLSLTERVLTEASIAGSRADAEAQASVILQNLQLKHENLTETINRYVVERLLTLQFGEPDAKLTALPLSDDKQTFYQEVYKQIIADPSIGPEVLARTDVEEIMEATGVPILEEAPELGYVDPMERAMEKQALVATPNDQQQQDPNNGPN